MAVVYKLTREDGLEYIGIAMNLGNRIKVHSRTPRFSDLKIDRVEVLHEGSWEECDALEESFIEKYDTYQNGLNVTPDGKGKTTGTKFNTLGYRYSEESKRKIGAATRARKPATGWKHRAETKEKYSKNRKGKLFRELKFDHSSMLDDYASFDATNSDYWMYCKKSEKGKILDRYTSPNGKPLTKDKMFVYFACKKYSVSGAAIGYVLRNKHAS